LILNSGKMLSALGGWCAVARLLAIGRGLLAHVEAWGLAMAFDFALEEALYPLGEAALLSISQGLSGFFDFGVQCDVGFFSHEKFIASFQKSVQYFSF
jgi:hypothetical protein